MNDKIKELTTKIGPVKYWCRDSSAKADAVLYTEEQLEEFAELIVRECAKDFDKTYMSGGQTMGDYIRQKFGVEE